MKTGEIRDLNLDEMHQKVSDLKEELFNLRFQLHTGHLENTARIGAVRKDIARVKTVLQGKQA